MVTFAIIELADGMTVVPVQPQEQPSVVAAANRGTLVDGGPYDTYEAAYDALCELEGSDEDERE